jgi:formate C-acetyltransferase
MATTEAWKGFVPGHWTKDVNVRDFIQRNYTQYEGDESFLEGPTAATDELWGDVQEFQKQERAKGGVLDCETEVVSGLTAYGPATSILSTRSSKRSSASRQTSL